MNILFLSISSLPNIKEHSISLDLIHQFIEKEHNVYVVCGLEKKENKETYISEEGGCKVLRVKIGNNKKANLIEKGITTLMLPKLYKKAIKKYFSDVKFDLILYPTPPVTQAQTVKYIKERDDAVAYLLLKDIFPQNAVDLGMLAKKGLKGCIYKYFRNKEKELYMNSDYIGCMSDANRKYLIKNNPQLSEEIVEICPNSIEIQDKSIKREEKLRIRDRYGLPQNKKIFIYGGNLGKPQGIPFLISCLEKVKYEENAYFLIVGDGTDYALLEEYVKKYRPKHVKLVKRLPKEEYDEIVAACDIGMIFLDYRFTIPNFPSRILSYMQAGLPILTCTDYNTDIGDMVENEKIGWKCYSNDIVSFEKCLKKAMEECSLVDSKHILTTLANLYSVEKAYNIIMKHIN